MLQTELNHATQAPLSLPGSTFKNSIFDKMIFGLGSSVFYPMSKFQVKIEFFPSSTATEHPILWSEQYRRFYDSKKKLTLKTYFFCEVKQLYLVQVFDFETVPALPRSSGPPRPSGKRRQRRQPRTYIKLSGQTSTKDLRSILLLHEFDSKKIFTIIKIIGRPLNLLFLTFDFFSLRASISKLLQ